MPVNVAAVAKQELSGEWESSVENDYTVHLNEGINDLNLRIDTLWEIAESDRRLTDSLVTEVPRTADEIVDRAHDMGAGDLFPKLSDEELAQIADDGKIPKHEIWGDRIKSGELAIDTLLNLAGLASFESDQQELDDRIEKLIAR